MNPSDDHLAKLVASLGIEVFRGSENDVHSRFIRILEKHMPLYFIRITGDCPLVMPNLIDKMIVKFENESLDYLSNANPPTYPDGLDIEIVSTEKFLEFSKTELSSREKEHVTLGLKERPGQFKLGNFSSSVDYSNYRWTVDYKEDLEFIQNVFKFFKGRETDFEMSDILNAIESGKIQDNQIPHTFRNIALKREVESD